MDISKKEDDCGEKGVSQRKQGGGGKKKGILVDVKSYGKYTRGR